MDAAGRIDMLTSEVCSSNNRQIQTWTASMQLLQLKIRGLGDVPETTWIPIESPVTIFRFSNRQVARNLLQAIQTINPPYNCRKKRPFIKYPTEFVTRDGTRKRIQPSKRTIAYAVFSAAPSLVTELGSITAPLYETDRIQVGRRLDYSRWISFVELAVSSRWNEIKSDINHLLEAKTISSPLQATIQDQVMKLHDTDRISGDIATVLENWLSGSKSDHAEQNLVDSVIEKVRRARYFGHARQIIDDCLPLFHSSGMDDFQKQIEENRRTETSEETRFPPISLIDLFEDSDRDANHLIDMMCDRSDTNKQCLCFVRDEVHVQSRHDHLIINQDEITISGVPASRHTR